MYFSAQSSIVLGALTLLGGLAEAKTDLAGCTQYTTIVSKSPYAVWFVPDTLEICSIPDCGGGRAPPKSKPGCPLYQGTETITPSFLPSDPLKTSKPTPASVPSTLATTTGSGTASAATGSGSDTTAGHGSSTASIHEATRGAGNGTNSAAESASGAVGGSGSAAITSPPGSKAGASASPSTPLRSAAAASGIVKGLPVLMGLVAAVMIL